jgi:hypothetical protein
LIETVPLKDAMGLSRQMARFVVREAKHAPIRGSVLLIGRQTISLTPERFSDLMREENMPVDPAIPVTLDTTTQKGTGKGYISDAYFFKALGADTVTAVDVSDYEGAEIVHNLDTPIPAQLEGKFDFICNGSVLDNMFNPIMGLNNISRMLASAGRVIHFEHASNTVNNAYLQFSPNWFFDYYAVNEFADCKAYIALFYDLSGPWDFYGCIHDGMIEPKLFRSSKFAMTAIIAERTSDSTWDRHPIQGQYRSPEDWARYLKCLGRFSDSTRPVIGRSSAGLGARAQLYLYEVQEFVRLAKHSQKIPQQSLLDILMCLLPPKYFAKRRGYVPLGKFY